MTCLTCENCGLLSPAELLSDDDGVRMFACCICGVASVEHSFPEPAAVPASTPPVPSGASLTGAAASPRRRAFLEVRRDA